MTGALKTVDKLSGDNYAVWEIRMKAVLVWKWVWKVINPMLEDRETDTTAAERISAPIILALWENQMVHVEDRTTARDACDELKKIFTETSAANRMRV